MTKQVFGFAEEEIEKAMKAKEPQLPNTFPIYSSRDALDACIAGGNKIREDEKMREILKQIYRS